MVWRGSVRRKFLTDAVRCEFNHIERGESMNRLNVDRLMEVMSDILSEKHGAKITLRAIPKEQAEEAKERKERASA